MSLLDQSVVTLGASAQGDAMLIPKEAASFAFLYPAAVATWPFMAGEELWRHVTSLNTDESSYFSLVGLGGFIYRDKHKKIIAVNGLSAFSEVEHSMHFARKKALSGAAPKNSPLAPMQNVLGARTKFCWVPPRKSGVSHGAFAFQFADTKQLISREKQQAILNIVQRGVGEVESERERGI